MITDFVLLNLMHPEISSSVNLSTVEINSIFLNRSVRTDFYIPEISPSVQPDLLLINDGQDLAAMGFRNMLDELHSSGRIDPVFCAAIHCGEDRKNEYGMVSAADFKGRGSKAPLYEKFIFEELLPYIEQNFSDRFPKKAFAGFSLGALSALDLVWNHPETFTTAAVFSGSLWWRSKDKTEKNYNEWTDRLMHNLVKNDVFKPGMRFFFECGELDETEDRNRNGVIDSIDDTLDLMRLLVNKGYSEGRDIRYLQLPDGKHDVQTWAKAFPEFLKWEWGRKKH
jgi:enterochelin esterase-like enzyme